MEQGKAAPNTFIAACQKMTVLSVNKQAWRDK